MSDNKTECIDADERAPCSDTTTFKQRFRGFSGHDSKLSAAFARRNSKRKFYRKTEAGKIDILIVPPGAISKDVKFADLLVVDESRPSFGVRHKSGLSRYANKVDVLTMSECHSAHAAHAPGYTVRYEA